MHVYISPEEFVMHIGNYMQGSSTVIVMYVICCNMF